MSDRERSQERGVGNDGKECLGGGDDDGDRGKSKAKGSSSAGGKEFAFGHKTEIKGSGAAPPHGASSIARTGASKLSYRDKLLSPGCVGFLVQHSETDDIVKGWKTYFRQMNVMEDRDEPGDSEKEDDTMAERVEGKPGTLKFTTDEYATWCLPWMNSLIIKVLEAHFPLYVIRDRINRMWRPKDPLKLIPLSNGYYIVSFSNKEDKEYAFQEGPWMIEDRYLIVQRWCPNFNPWKADLQCNIAAWIRLPDVSFEFYNVESLCRIGNMVGKMIKVDQSTSVYDKGGFARICVEIDLKKPLLPTYTIFSEERPIIYEGLHQVCFVCGKYGHQKESCTTGHDEAQGKKEGPSMVTLEAGDVSGKHTSSELGTCGSTNTSGEAAGDECRFGKIKILKHDFRGNQNAAKSKGELNDNLKAKFGQQVSEEKSDPRRMKSKQEIRVNINDQKGDLASSSPVKSEWVQDAIVEDETNKEGVRDRHLNGLGPNIGLNLASSIVQERPNDQSLSSMDLMGSTDQLPEQGYWARIFPSLIQDMKSHYQLDFIAIWKLGAHLRYLLDGLIHRVFQTWS
ncbi:hypothetical protein K1719_036757 [Acacia pycnantha]|nr:hypothetical protein K1719_036757 [Acacia pycnantha]